MDTLPFSYNWNKKLDCKAFTTIRLYNPNKYFVGNCFTIIENQFNRGKVRIEAVKAFHLDKLNPFMSYIDTGYSVEECRNIILKMYPKIDFKTKKLAFILCVKQDAKPVQGSII